MTDDSALAFESAVAVGHAWRNIAIALGEAGERGEALTTSELCLLTNETETAVARILRRMEVFPPIAERLDARPTRYRLTEVGQAGYRAWRQKGAGSVPQHDTDYARAMGEVFSADRRRAMRACRADFTAVLAEHAGELSDRRRDSITEALLRRSFSDVYEPPDRA
jgi:hypothetical protein